MRRQSISGWGLSLILICISLPASAQRFLTDIMDTTRKEGEGLYPVYREQDRLKFSGYMQPQFQWISSKGAETYGGGDFQSNSDQRFMLRRGRVRVDYLHFNARSKPTTYFAFQFDGTERGVNIRDLWGRFYENKWELFSVTAGMFARPMGFELNHSSSDRETPERGRMSQILMKTERDMGVMLSFSPRKESSQWKWLRLDLGVFNGQGMTGPQEYDGKKDWVGRLSLQPQTIPSWGWTVSASVSAYRGGIVSQSDQIAEWAMVAGKPRMILHRSDEFIQSVRPRKYSGADIQIRIPNRKGHTELRAEYMRGQQTATAETSETPGTYPVEPNLLTPLPLYTRDFDGGYFYFLQHLGTPRVQWVVKYDWYDPNIRVKGENIRQENGFTAADILYQTWTTGFLFHINPHAKAFLFYDRVQNEESRILGYEKDVEDNLLTLRLQFRF